MHDGSNTTGSVYRKIEYANWAKWFAWRPVTIKGRKKWLTYVYRRRVSYWTDMSLSRYYEYGTLFDVIGDK